MALVMYISSLLKHKFKNLPHFEIYKYILLYIIYALGYLVNRWSSEIVLNQISTNRKMAKWIVRYTL